MVLQEAYSYKKAKSWYAKDLQNTVQSEVIKHYKKDIAGWAKFCTELPNKCVLSD